MSAAGRKLAGTTKLWYSDPATYPIIAIISLAVGGASFQIARNCVQNPDVQFNATRRATFLNKFNEEDGAAWKQHRSALANIKTNPINALQHPDIPKTF